MININKITKKYFGYDEVIKSLSLDIADGEKIAIYGAAGSGKTTLLKIIAGLIPLTSGEIIINGENCDNIKFRNKNITMIFEDLAIRKYGIIKNILKKPFLIRGMKRNEARKKVLQVALDYRLTSILDNVGLLISKYDAVRLAVARGFMREPETLLIDNPLKLLTIRDRREYVQELSQYINRSKGTIIYATDDIEELKYFNGRIIMLEYGVIKQIGTYSELTKKPDCIMTAREFNSHNINFFEGKLIKENDEIFAEIANLRYKFEDKSLIIDAIEREVIFGIYADRITITEKGELLAEILYRRNDNIASVRCKLSENPVYCNGTNEGHFIDIDINGVLIFDNVTEKIIN